MFLKRLEIFGFKSFADKTVFEFPEGTTAIIGPNGCGKSNVVEAIRWVLGEQNPNNLRSKSMCDIIFNGSETRRPVGLAEVTLTLDNSRKNLPIEFEEVSISRRLLRSGESEYLINKASCRLKDITDLFLDTGIGRNAYSLIEQGKVDLILNSKPEERRSFFEEAAGVSKYRSRREATLHKLESTTANLLRLEDVLAEIKRQMNSLYRQKRRAEEYKTLREEMRRLEVRLGQNEYQKINRDWNQTLQELEGLKALLIKKREERDCLSLRFDKIRLKAKGIQEELHLLQVSLQELVDRIQGINGEIIRANERKKHLDSEVTRMTQELEKIKVKTIQIDSKKDGEILARKECKERLLAKKEALTAKEEKLALIEEERKQLILDLESSKEEVIELLSQTAHIRNRLSTLRAEEKNINIQLSRLKKEEEELGENKKRLLEWLSQEEKILSGKEEKHSFLLTEISQDEAIIHEEEKILSDLDEQINSLRAELKGVEVRFDTLKRLEEDLAGYLPGVKAILTTKDRLKGIRGVVADLFDVPAQYEAAIEAVLGENLQAVVIERREDAISAINYLKEEGDYRVTFLPLDSLKIDPPLKDLDDPGIVRLLDLIRFEPESEAAFLHLLGRAYLVNGLDEIPESLQQEIGYLKFVTTNGDVFDTNGVISGGGQRNRGFGLLGRKRILNDLTKRLNHLKTHLFSLEKEHKNKRDELRVLKEEFSKKKRELQELEISISNGRKECERAQERMREFEINLKNLKQEQYLQSEELNKIHQEIKDLTLTQRELILATRKKENLISNLTEKTNEKEILIKEYNLEITQLKVDIAGLEERIEALAGSISRLEELSYSLKKEEVFLRENLDKVFQEREETQERISSLTQEMNTLLQKRLHKEEKLSQIRILYEQVEGEMASCEEELTRKRREIEELNEKVYQLEFKTSQLKMKMEDICEHLEREYGLFPDEITSGLEEELPEGTIERIEELRKKIAQMGEINFTAPQEYEELEARYKMMNEQRDDLISSQKDLRKIIDQIDQTSRELFLATFNQIRSNFQKVYQELFEGGKADLIMTKEDPLETGIDIIAQPPGKKLQNISLLSGGERAMMAIALLFAIFMIKPSPFCVLDEIDAALDDVNITRFTKMLKRFSQISQFLIITHNKRTMEIADTLYGITMQEQGVSKLISVRWKEAG